MSSTSATEEAPRELADEATSVDRPPVLILSDLDDPPELWLG